MMSDDPGTRDVYEFWYCVKKRPDRIMSHPWVKKRPMTVDRVIADARRQGIDCTDDKAFRALADRMQRGDRWYKCHRDAYLAGRYGYALVRGERAVGSFELWVS